MELEKGMNAAEFVVVQDAFLNETCRFADVVFPASVFAEKEGVFTNSERRVQRVRKAVEPPGEAREDWRILIDLANASGADWSFDSASDVYDELVRDADKFSGISHARLDATVELPKTGLQWPCPTPDHPGTTFLHEEGILRGKGLFQAVDYRPPAELPDEIYGLLLSTGRTLYHYNCATQTRRESGLDAKQSEAWVEIHPRDAKKRGIEDRDMVEISTRRGSVQVRALYSRQVQPRCIWMPLHFFEARANVITNDAGDPVTDTAEYKVCAAEVRKIEAGEAREGLYPGTFYGIDAPV
jgi:predicted molibdopterin-dependent oxidoreductase YjgC